MKKLYNILLGTLVFVIILTGCSNQLVNKAEEYKKSLTYSNLVDAASQEGVRKAMESAGISSIILFYPCRRWKTFISREVIFSSTLSSNKV